ncbi:MAG: hypothetical protein HQK76_14035 [Desulfobacterales bacterium]|nr:hypothetical protein [Desulfobacterales bacterium]
MKKVLFGLFIFIMCVVLNLNCEAGTFEVEPNDHMAQANLISSGSVIFGERSSSSQYEIEPNNNKFSSNSIVSGRPVRGHISKIIDQDWFLIKTTVPDTIHVYFKLAEDNEEGEDTYVDCTPGIPTDNVFDIIIEDAEENVIDKKEFDVKGEAKYLFFSVTANKPGSYFVVVKNCDRKDNYLLTVAVSNSSSHQYEIESNNDRNTAQQLIAGMPVTGNISSSSDEDYFAIGTSGLDFINIYFKASQPNGNLKCQISVEDEKGYVLSQMDYDSSLNEPGVYSIEAENAGFYYVKVYNAQSTDNYNLTLSVFNEEDWFLIDVPSQGLINVTYKSEADSHTKISIKDSSNNILSADSYYSGWKYGYLSKFFAAATKPGKYYIVLSNSYALDRYSFTTTFTETDISPFEFEPNEKPEQAVFLGSGTEKIGQFSSIDDIDWYSVVTNGPDIIKVNFVFEGNLDYDAEIAIVGIDKNDASILNILAMRKYTYFSNEKEDPIIVEAYVPESGTYYIRLKECKDFANSYRVKVTTSNSSSIPYEIEPNDIMAKANFIQLGDTVRGQLSSEDDNDWFSFQTDSADDITISFLKEAPLNEYPKKHFNCDFFIKDSDGKILMHDTYYGGYDNLENERLKINLPFSGTYYLILKYRIGDNYYKLKLTSSKRIADSNIIETSEKNIASEKSGCFINSLF